jgi:hypothetical protein
VTASQLYYVPEVNGVPVVLDDDPRFSGGGVAGPTGYRHDQVVPATVWTISHGLGFDPAGLTVISDDGDTIDGAVVQYLTAGQSMRLSFDVSFAGSAYLS